MKSEASCRCLAFHLNRDCFCIAERFPLDGLRGVLFNRIILSCLLNHAQGLWKLAIWGKRFYARIDIPSGYTGIMDGWRVKLDFHICIIKQVEGGCDKGEAAPGKVFFPGGMDKGHLQGNYGREKIGLEIFSALSIFG